MKRRTIITTLFTVISALIISSLGYYTQSANKGKLFRVNFSGSTTAQADKSAPIAYTSAVNDFSMHIFESYNRSITDGVPDPRIFSAEIFIRQDTLMSLLDSITNEGNKTLSQTPEINSIADNAYQATVKLYTVWKYSQDTHTCPGPRVSISRSSTHRYTFDPEAGNKALKMFESLLASSKNISLQNASSLQSAWPAALKGATYVNDFAKIAAALDNLSRNVNLWKSTLVSDEKNSPYEYTSSSVIEQEPDGYIKAKAVIKDASDISGYANNIAYSIYHTLNNAFSLRQKITKITDSCEKPDAKQLEEITETTIRMYNLNFRYSQSQASRKINWIITILFAFIGSAIGIGFAEICFANGFLHENNNI